MAYNTTKTQDVMERNVRFFLNEPTAVSVTDAEIDAFLDYGARELSEKSLCNEEVIPITLTSAYNGQFAFTLSAVPIARTDIILIQDVFWMGASTSGDGNSKGLEKIHPKMISHQKPNTASTVPNFWSFQNETLYVWPPLTITTTVYIDLLCYTFIPSYYTTGTTTYNVPDNIDELMIWYALAQSYEKQGKFAPAQMYKGIFDAYAYILMGDRFLKPVDSLDQMTLKDNSITR